MDDPQATVFEDAVELGDDGLALTPGSAIGRYIVLSKLGAGAMGVVFMAYDPELDRRVAVKLLGPQHRRAGVLLRREAQALAKLADPNVVAVFDVGQHREQVFVTMEYIAGQTLTDWLRQEPRPDWPTILAMLLAAGRGLAAAHGRELIHRDFKPDNVMIGADGRARVMDFGLARSDRNRGTEPADGESEDLRASASGLTNLRLTRTGVVAGTPAYMAPEQYLGEPTALSDQFGFCVTLFEALYATHPYYRRGHSRRDLSLAVAKGELVPIPSSPPIPSWIREALIRGMSPKPEHRFASMHELLATLTHDPRVRRRRVAATLLGVGALAALVWASWPSEGASPSVCTGFEDELGEVWGPSQALALRERFAGSNKSYAATLADRVVARFDAFGANWVATRRDACERHEGGRQSDPLFDLRMRCLDESLDALAAATAVLTEAASGAAPVDRATQIADGLPELARCSEVDALVDALPLPDDPALRTRIATAEARVTQLSARQRAGHFDEVEAGLDALGPELGDLAYPPLTARAHMVRAALLMSIGRSEDAIPLFERVYAIALEHQMLDQAVGAAIQLMSLAGSSRDTAEEGRRWRLHTEPLVLALDNEAVSATLLSTIARIEASEGDYEGAIAGYLEAERMLLTLDEGRSLRRLTYVYNGLGLAYQATNQDQLALESFTKHQRVYEKLFGPRHPRISDSMINRSTSLNRLGRQAEALEVLELALDIRTEVFGPDDHNVGRVIGSLGLLAMDMGDHAKARDYYRRALAIMEASLGPRHANVALIRHNLGEALRLDGHYEEALTHYEAALPILEPLGNGGYPLTGIGQLELARGRPEAALEALEAALVAFAAKPAPAAQMGEVYFATARALDRCGGHNQRALDLARKAHASYAEAAEPDEDVLATIDAWLRGR